MPNMKDKQQEIASTLVNTQANQLAMVTMCFTDAGQKATICMSAAMVGIAALCQGLTRTGKVGHMFVPSSDDVLFACTFIAESVQFTSDGSLNVEFSFDNVVKALDLFRTRTGRPYEPVMDESLLQLITQVREKADASFPDGLSGFKPQ